MHHRASLALVLLLAACSKNAQVEPGDGPGAGKGTPPKDRGPVVAKVGSVELHEADVQRAKDREPGGASLRFQTLEARRELIDGLIRFELLSQAATRAGYDSDPDAIHALHQVAVAKFVNDSLGNIPLPGAIPKEDVQREYEARQAAQYSLPGAVRVRHIRVADRKLADKLVAQAKALAPDDDAGFAKLATDHTEDEATRAVGGDLGMLDGKTTMSPYLTDLLPKLQTPGEVVGPVQTNAGWEIVRVVSIRAPAVSPLSSVENSLRQRLYQDRRQKALDERLAQLRKETPVEIVDKTAAPAASH